MSIKTASTREIIEKLQAFEKEYGIGAVDSIGAVCSGDRDTEYVFYVKDKNNNEIKININSIKKSNILTN